MLVTCLCSHVTTSYVMRHMEVTSSLNCAQTGFTAACLLFFKEHGTMLCVKQLIVRNLCYCVLAIYLIVG